MTDTQYREEQITCSCTQCADGLWRDEMIADIYLAAFLRPGTTTVTAWDDSTRTHTGAAGTITVTILHGPDETPAGWDLVVQTPNAEPVEIRAPFCQLDTVIEQLNDLQWGTTAAAGEGN